MTVERRREVPVRIILESPPKDVLYGIQRGRGSGYDVDFAQQPERADVTFEFAITAPISGWKVTKG